MNLPLATDLKSRDGALDQDAKVLNGIIELSGEESEVRSRPGTSDYGLVRVGTGQMLANWKGIKTVIADYYNAGLAYTGSYTNSTTWNASDKTANVTLSGGNLTATTTAVGTSGVRSTYGHSSGVWYFEVTVDAGNQCYLGFCTAAHDFTFVSPNQYVIYVDITAYGYAYVSNVLGGASFTYVPTIVNTDVVSCLYDADTGLIQFYKNGVGFASTTVTPGTTLHAYYGMPSIVGAVTANFAGAFTYTPVVGASALVITTPSLPFQSANTGETATTQYIMFKNSEYAWYATSAGVVTKVGSNYPAYTVGTVPGVIYLDTYFIVMDVTGKLYNSARNDPATWGALDFIVAANEPGAGVALAKSQNYAIALKEYSIEPFYNAANPVGSILSPVDNGFQKIGCASAGSVATKDESVVFMSQSRQKGRGIHVLTGIQAQEISTPDVERVLNADDLATVHSYCIRVDGHDLYVLTLVSSNITLVYDFTSKAWSQWSSLTISASKSITSIVRSGSTVTVTFGSAHGMSDGDPLKISGATPSDYNGIWQVSYVSSTVVTFEITGTPTATATGTLLGYTYTESYFKYTKYVNYSGVDLFLHESDGHVYSMEPALFQDNAQPINLFCRTPRLDFGGLGKKKIPHVGVAADKVASSILIRHSDDDCTTFSDYRAVDLSVQEPKIRRSKSFRRRTYEVRHVGNYPIRIKYLDVEAQK